MHIYIDIYTYENKNSSKNRSITNNPLLQCQPCLLIKKKMSTMFCEHLEGIQKLKDNEVTQLL